LCYLDLNAFRAGLEKMRDEAMMDAESLATVSTFLDAWDRKQLDGND